MDIDTVASQGATPVASPGNAAASIAGLVVYSLVALAILELLHWLLHLAIVR